MEIEVALLPQLLRTLELNCSIVIDTFRFTTTACQALCAGADAVIVGSEIEEVKQLAAKSTQPAKLCGERNCEPISGFDLGNSPWEYTTEVVQSQQLCFTTTNGTRAIEACRNSDQILLAALVNRIAVCKYLLQNRPDRVTIVCAGTEQEVSLEDSTTAGAIIEYLLENSDAQLVCDSSQMCLATWSNVSRRSNSDGNSDSVKRSPQESSPGTLQRQLLRALSHAKGGRNLLDAGYERDLEFAVDLDRLDCVPRSDRQNWNQFRLQ